MKEYTKPEAVTCKDCFHYKVCGSFGFVLDPLHGGVICNDFVNTADVVEIVRCKDCKYLRGKDYCYLTLNYRVVEPNHFCSYGERKTN